MLYTVKPLERIYAPPEMFQPPKGKQEGSKEEAKADYKEVILPSGRIVTRRDGENYVIEKVNSTDMKDYLNDKYALGKNYQE